MKKVSNKIGFKSDERTIRIVLSGQDGRPAVRELVSPSSHRKETAKLERENRSIFLDSDTEHLYLWVKFEDSRDLEGEGMFLYILKKEDKGIWHGSILSDSKIVKGKSVEFGSAEYPCLLNSMKSYLGELFLGNPNDLRILEALYELNRQYDSLTDIFVRLLVKMKAKKQKS